MSSLWLVVIGLLVQCATCIDRVAVQSIPVVKTTQDDFYLANRNEPWMLSRLRNIANLIGGNVTILTGRPIDSSRKTLLLPGRVQLLKKRWRRKLVALT